MRSKYYLADRLPGYLINLSLLNDRYWAASLPRASIYASTEQAAQIFSGQAGSLRSTAVWLSTESLLIRTSRKVPRPGLIL
jgi:hypothetical protein